MRFPRFFFVNRFRNHELITRPSVSTTTILSFEKYSDGTWKNGAASLGTKHKPLLGESFLPERLACFRSKIITFSSENLMPGAITGCAISQPMPDLIKAASALFPTPMGAFLSSLCVVSCKKLHCVSGCLITRLQSYLSFVMADKHSDKRRISKLGCSGNIERDYVFQYTNLSDTKLDT